jgi:hypothetical protein
VTSYGFHSTPNTCRNIHIPTSEISMSLNGQVNLVGNVANCLLKYTHRTGLILYFCLF